MWNLWSSMTLLPVNWDGQCLIFSMLDWHVKSMFTLTQGTYFPWMLLQLQQTDTTGPSWEFSGHTGCRPDQNTAWNLELMAIQRLYKERSFRCNSSSILISLLIISERAFMHNQFGCLLFSQCFRAGVFSSLSPPRSFGLPRFLLFVGVSTCHSHEQSFF